MSEDDLIQEIKEMYLFLTEKEPTPDDEIEAREKLISQFKALKPINSNSALDSLISQALSKLENWDTLDLWFKEVEDLSELINEIIINTDKASKVEPAKDEPKSTNTPSSPQIDISEIVAQVSDQFKGEIGGLKDKIAELQKELAKKESETEEIKKEPPKKKPAAKKRQKLAPPQIKIPVIKRPEPKPKIEKPKIEAVSVEKPKIEAVSVEKPKIEAVSVEKPKIEAVSVEKLKIEAVSVEKPKIEAVSVEKPKIEVSAFGTPKISRVSAEKPKIEAVAVEKPKLTPITAEKPKIEAVAVKKPKLTPISVEKPKIEVAAVEKPSIQPVATEAPSFTVSKPKIQPIATEKPSISPVSMSGSTTKKPGSSQLFNAFSSMREKPTSQPSQAIQPVVDSSPNKTKKKRGEKRKKKENVPGTGGSTSFEAFGGSIDDIDATPTDSSMSSLPADKDSLYQELIALEGRRFSIEKIATDLEKSYQKGSIDDFEYKSKSDEFKYKLKEITERINTIRRMISTL